MSRITNTIKKLHEQGKSAYAYARACQVCQHDEVWSLLTADEQHSLTNYYHNKDEKRQTKLDPLKYANDTEQPTSEDYSRCRCGHDQYSRMPLVELLGHVPYDVTEKVQPMDEKTAVRVLRWYLRGLVIGKAIGKFKAENLMAEKMKRRHEREFIDERAMEIYYKEELSNN